MALENANAFHLKGRKVKIDYSSSSIAGSPTLQYEDGRLKKSFTGTAIRSKSTSLGTELTVTLSTVPDARVDTFTLILPEVHVSGGRPSAIKVLGVQTKTRSSIGGPALVKGPLATYAPVELKGTAEHVLF